MLAASPAALAEGQEDRARGLPEGCSALPCNPRSPLTSVASRPTRCEVWATVSIRHRSPARPVIQADPSGAKVISIGSLTDSGPATVSTENPGGRWTSAKAAESHVRITMAVVSRRKRVRMMGQVGGIGSKRPARR